MWRRAEEWFHAWREDPLHPDDRLPPGAIKRKAQPPQRPAQDSSRAGGGPGSGRRRAIAARSGTAVALDGITA